MKLKSGFSLLELVLAIAIFSFSSFTLATMIIDSNISTRLSADRTEALLYAKEGVEAVRSIRDNDWATWASTTDGYYGLLIDEASSTWAFNASTSDLINDKYTRMVNLATDLEVDTSRDVSVNISWDLTSGRIASTTIGTVFSNWPDVVNSTLVVPRGLVSYYSFDGNANDSVSGYNGTVYGSTLATGTKGVINTAYSFNGSSNYVNISGSLNATSYTISVWFKTIAISPDTNVGQKIVMIQRVSGSTKFCLQMRNNQPELMWADSSPSLVELSTGVTTNDGAWHHFVGTTDGTVFNVYLDGVLKNTNSSSSLTSLFTGMYIGANASSNAFFNGSIDDIRIYNRALSPDEITTIYNAERP